MAGQLGLEATPEEYISNLVAVGRELWRVLRDDGTFFLNLGDSYWGGKGQSSQAWSTEHQDRDTLQKEQHQITGMGQTRPNDGKHDILKPKDLMMIPARVAIALQQAGWYLRAAIVWAKPNPMPESVSDRPTRSHEMIYLLTKKPRYYYDAEAVKEPYTGGIGHDRVSMPWQDHAPVGTRNDAGRMRSDFYKNGGRNQRDVWTLATEPYSGAHYATFSTEIPRRAILAGTSAKGHCTKCGKGWARMVEKKTRGHDWNKNNRNGGNRMESGQSLSEAMPDDYEVKTLGWQPACKCNANVVPAIILDPFCGSGTVGEVCRELGRQFVGLDLSMKYLRENALPRAERSQTPESIARLPLFGGNGDEQLPLKQDGTGNPTYTGFNTRWKEIHSD